MNRSGRAKNCYRKREREEQAEQHLLAAMVGEHKEINNSQDCFGHKYKKWGKLEMLVLN